MNPNFLVGHPNREFPLTFFRSLEIFFEHNPNVLWDSSWDNATCWAPGTGGKYCDPGVLADGGGGVRGVLCADLGAVRSWWGI